MAVADHHDLLVSVCVESATPHEVTLATSTLLQMVVPEAPQNLIGDNASDSDHISQFAPRRKMGFGGVNTPKTIVPTLARTAYGG